MIPKPEVKNAITAVRLLARRAADSVNWGLPVIPNFGGRMVVLEGSRVHRRDMRHGIPLVDDSE